MINKEDLINKVLEKTKMNRNEVETVVDSFLDAIVDGLVEGEEVKIVRFGKFNAKKRVARNIVNPATKEMMRLPALANVLFRPSQNVKDLLNK
jgi:nucleoid DNA-binding protein